LAGRRRDHRLPARHDRNNRDRSSPQIYFRHDESRAGAWHPIAPRTSRRHRPEYRWIDRQGVQVDADVIEADAVVIAMGPWSLIAAAWMSLPAVFGQRSPSLVYETGTDIPADALFLEVQQESGGLVSLEVFPRADGSTHVTAFSDIVPLPLDPASVAPEPDVIDRLQAICERLSPVFRPERIIARQACFRPVTEDGLPLIGKVPLLDGAYVATGHNVWGILNAPATGEALAELIADGVARTTDLTPFDPTRLRALDPSLLRSS
jgi:glycine/D-amino acid oxidase-like deaminating enzyme